MLPRNGIIAIIVVYVLFVCATAFAQDGPADGSAAPMQEGADATPWVDTRDDAVANNPQASERVEGEATTTSGPVIGLADLHLHQWAHFMNGGQWMFGDASGVAHEHLTECGWHTGDEMNFEGHVTPRQRHGQGIGHRRAGRTVTRAPSVTTTCLNSIRQPVSAGTSRCPTGWVGRRRIPSLINRCGRVGCGSPTMACHFCILCTGTHRAS